MKSQAMSLLHLALLEGEVLTVDDLKGISSLLDAGQPKRQRRLDWIQHVAAAVFQEVGEDKRGAY